MVKNVAIVTGGSSGIGAEFASQLASRGYNLLLVSNQAEALEQTRLQILSDRPTLQCLTLFKDLSQPDSAREIVEYSHSHSLEVEVLVNNAGIFTFKLMEELTEAQLNLYIDLHMRTVTHLSLLIASDMKRRGHGYILNMSSMSCWMPMPGIGMYAATKAYIRIFSRSLHLEMKDYGVKVMAACPGGIATDLFGLPEHLQRLGVRLGALATTESFVKGALKRLLRGDKQYVNGIINKLSVVAVSLTPTWARLIIKHRMLDRHEDGHSKK